MPELQYFRTVFPVRQGRQGAPAVWSSTWEKRRALPLLDQPFPDGPHAGFGARGGVHLGEDVRDVLLRGERADAQRTPDLLVRFSSSHQVEDGVLTEGEPVGVPPH